MNKFVKGAKNLAFALSFVTVAACGVKKEDLEKLKKELESVKGSIPSQQDLGEYAKKGEVEGKVKGEIDAFKNGDFRKVSDNLSKLENGEKERIKNQIELIKPRFLDCSKSAGDFSKIVLNGGDCKGLEIKKIKINDSDGVVSCVKDENWGFAFNSGDTIENCTLGLYNFVLAGGLISFDDNVVISDGGNTNKIKINGFACGNFSCFEKCLNLLYVLRAGGVDLIKVFGFDKSNYVFPKDKFFNNGSDVLSKKSSEGLLFAKFIFGEENCSLKNENEKIVVINKDGKVLEWEFSGK